MGVPDIDALLWQLASPFRDGMPRDTRVFGRTWLDLRSGVSSIASGVTSGPAPPCGRFLPFRTVMLGATAFKADLGDACGGVLLAAGSFDLAD